MVIKNNQFTCSFLKHILPSPHILLQFIFKFKVFSYVWYFEISVGGMSRNVSNNTLNPVTWLFTNVVLFGKQMVIETDPLLWGPEMLCLISPNLSLSVDKGLFVPVVQIGSLTAT